MKILHTADWHLGHRLHEQSQYEEQSRFLTWLHGHILENKVDVLLLSGDVFDTASPSAQSLTLYYDFLVGLKGTCCQHIVITGGNHDAPGTLNAPKELLQALDIMVVGKATDPIDQEVFQLNVGSESVLVAAVPYLRDQDIRRALAGETFTEIGERYKKALLNHYQDISVVCEEKNTNKIPCIAMGHLFANGGATSDSEQTIYVGNLGDIGADDFPTSFDYIALGHLHRPQIVGKKNHIRYSGSPYCLSFSEVGMQKKIIEIEISEDKISDIHEIEIPSFRTIKKVKGSSQTCIDQLHQINNETHEITPWVEVILDQNKEPLIDISSIQEAVQNMDLQVLKISIANEKRHQGIENQLTHTYEIKDLQPMDVFSLKCEENDIDLNEHPDLRDAFSEVLQLVKKG